MMTKQILDAIALERTITRMAHEILEKNNEALKTGTGASETAGLVLIGIHTRGVVLAKKLQKAIETIAGIRLPLGTLDINLYRDDLTRVSEQPIIRKTEINFDLDNKVVVLVDDVLYTGRTIRAALDAIIDFGRPRIIELAALVDRGHRELPIRADFVGKNIPTSETEVVQVRFSEIDKKDEVVVEDDKRNG